MTKYESGQRVVVGPEVATPGDEKWIGQVGKVLSIALKTDHRVVYNVELDGEEHPLQFFEEDLTA